MLGVFLSTKVRYLLVGIAAFVLGSATIGAAAASDSLGSLFYTTILNGQPTQPCVTQTTGQGSTTVCTAIVDSNGNLHVANQGTSTVSGTVGVNNFPAVQQVGGTVNVGNLPAVQQVGGTVNVGNLPATQNVNVTGGTLSTSVQGATSECFGFAFGSLFDSQHPFTLSCAQPFHVTSFSFVINSGDDVNVQFGNSNGSSSSINFRVRVHGSLAMSFEHPLVADEVFFDCLGNCEIGYSIVGY